MKKNSMNKRGQAALEFLSTYGFAFLIILVMVGALTYFGVLNPQGLVPNRCLSGNGITCKEVQLSVNAAGTIAYMNVSFQNDRGKQIQLTNATVNTMNATATGYGVGGCAQFAAPLSAASGARFLMNCSLVGTFPAKGEKLKIVINFPYMDTGNSFDQPGSAEITQTIQ